MRDITRRTLAAASVLAGALLCMANAQSSDVKTDDRRMVQVPRALEPAFRNTLLSTYPDGRTARLWLDRDGGYQAQGRRGDRSSGHWKIKADRLCLKQSHPLPVPFSFCAPLIAGGVGKTWPAKAVTGESIRVKLVRGRSGENG